MRFSDIKTIISATIASGDTSTVPIILGSPGCGKTALCYEIGAELGFDHTDDLNISILDTPDLAGLALMGDHGSDVLSFKKSPLLAPFQTGRNLLILDEVPDGNMGMQNLARRILWTREINGLKLSPETFIVMTGNRTTDKSGAGRLSGKVKNAVSQYTLESNLEEWVDNFAMPQNLDPIMIQYLRYAQKAATPVFDQYDANADFSPTPRQWELVSKVPGCLPDSLFYAAVAAKVGDGPAAGYTAFRGMYMNLVSYEDVVLDPKGAPVPEKLDCLYAITGSLANNVTANTIDRVVEYIGRLPKDFEVMFWMDARKKTPALKGTKAFMKWATANQNVILN